MRNDNSTERESHLVAEFRIEPDDRANCSILAAGSRGNEIRQTIVTEDGTSGPGCDCRAEAVVGSDNKRQYLESKVTDYCVCPVFNEHDCISSIVAFEEDELLISLSVPDREELKKIVEELRAINAEPRLQQLTTGSVDHREEQSRLDNLGLTEKQREAVAVAFETGYYDTPRRACLRDLSEELDISKSAVSQRLTAVETQLVSQLVRSDRVDGNRTESKSVS